MAITILIVAVVVGVLIMSVRGLLHLASTTPRHTRLFSGPKGLPYIGNLLTTPMWGAVFHFKLLTDKYGPITETTLLGQRFLLLSSTKVVDELLNAKGRAISGRPNTFAVKDAQSKFGTSEYLPLMSFNSDHHRQKRVGRAYMSGIKAHDHYGHPLLEVKRLMLMLSRRGPEGHVEWIRMTEDLTSRTISRLVFGTPDHANRLHDETWQLLVWVSPNGVSPNLLPFLDLLPAWLSPWKHMENTRHSRQQGWFKDIMEGIRKDIATGTAPACLMRDYLTNANGNATYASDDDASKAMGMIATAAIFTVSGPIQNVVRALACFPEWQPKLQAELNKVAPFPTLPGLDDLPALPLLRAFLRETTRWRQAIPSGIPHEAEEDVIYRGTVIPKGTALFPLEYGINRDPDVYQNPYDFDPMRWLDPASPNYRAPTELYPSLGSTPMFGWGRRYCMGHELASDEIYLFSMYLIWSFDLKLSDPSSVEKNLLPGEKRGGHQWPTARDQALIIMRPEKIKVEFHVRADREDLVNAAYETPQPSAPLWSPSAIFVN